MHDESSEEEFFIIILKEYKNKEDDRNSTVDALINLIDLFKFNVYMQSIWL